MYQYIYFAIRDVFLVVVTATILCYNNERAPVLLPLKFPWCTGIKAEQPALV